MSSQSHRSPRKARSSRRKKRAGPVQTNVFGDPIVQPRFTGLAAAGLDKVYDFVQTIDQTSLGTSSGPWIQTATATGFAATFTFGALAQVASFQALYDQYRIVQVEQAFVPRVTTMINTSAALSAGVFNCYVDFDDAAVPGSVTVAQTRSNCITVPGYEKVVVVYKPHVLSAAYAGAAVIGNVTGVCPWLDCANTTVTQYGVKAFWTAGSAALPLAYDIITRVHIQFKNVA
jgi:hypothetical protein